METQKVINGLLDTYAIEKIKPRQNKYLYTARTRNENEALIKSVLAKRSPGLDGFTAEICQNFKEDPMPILLNYSIK